MTGRDWMVAGAGVIMVVFLTGCMILVFVLIFNGPGINGYRGAPISEISGSGIVPAVKVVNYSVSPADPLQVSQPAHSPNLSAITLQNFAPGEIPDPDQVAMIALNDPSARRMYDLGGELAGVRMAVKRASRAHATDGGVFPALLIRYNGIEVDFLVDPVEKKPTGRSVQIPNGASILEKNNMTIIEYNGTELFSFEPFEAFS